MSLWSRCSFRCWSSVPPAPWTMHFGTPVVPEEYMMKSGWLKGSRAKSIGPAA